MLLAIAVLAEKVRRKGTVHRRHDVEVRVVPGARLLLQRARSLHRAPVLAFGGIAEQLEEHQAHPLEVVLGEGARLG